MDNEQMQGLMWKPNLGLPNSVFLGCSWASKSHYMFTQGLQMLKQMSYFMIFAYWINIDQHVIKIIWLDVVNNFVSFINDGLDMIFFP